MSTVSPMSGTKAPEQLSRRRIAGNFLTLATTGILGVGITILITVYVRRIIGPAGIGQVSWAMATVSYLTVLVSPGLAVVGQRDLARAPDQSERLLSLVLTLQTLLALLVYGLVVIGATFEPRGSTMRLLLIIQGLTLILNAWNTGWALQAHERMVAPSLAALTFSALQLPALVLLVHSPDDLVTYAALALPFAFAGVVYNFWYLARRGFVRPLQLRPTLAGTRWMLREAWPLALAQGAVLLMLNSGTFILGFSASDAAVGQFASAYRLMLMPAVITAALWNAYFPAFARSHDRPAEASALSREYLGLLAWIGLPIAALGWALGRHMVDLLYGPAFAPSGRYFEWLCLTIGFTFLNYGFVATLVPWGRSGLQLRITASAALLNLMINVLAVPFYGPWAAVGAAIASEVLVVLLGIAIRRRLGLFWHPILPIIGPPLLCSTIVAVGLAALPASFDRLWWAQLLAGAALLGACSIAFEGRTLLRLWQTFRLRRKPSVKRV